MTYVPPAPLARYEPQELSVEELVARVRKVKEVHTKLMVEDEHYGKIPGAKKPSLWKAGAELLGLAFRLDPQFDIAEKTYTDDGHLTVVIKCTLYHAPSGSRMGSGLGSCSTRESKYAWRQGERLCPKCSKPTIIKGKDEYGGGWVCFGRKGGCGAKFKDGDQSIEGQQTGRVPNPDIADQYNTCLKMGCKRAHVAATLFVTGASEIFTQDLEDAAPEDDEPAPRKPGSGAAGPGTRISPHDHPDEPDDPTRELDAVFSGLLRELHDLEEAVAKVTRYDEALTLRHLLGSKASRSELTKRIQTAREEQRIGSQHHQELGRTWQRIDRQLTRVTKELTPDAAASFTDHEDGEQHDEMGKPL